jgi:short-subunit dehydrogenase/DNA-binding CsgD family transcriptional regulator
VRRVLLTGASSGIGAELARVLAARGDRLAVAARRRERLEALAGELTPRPVVFAVDVARRGEEAAAALGGIDVLINDAGGGVGGRIATLGDRDEAREAFEVNYWSPLALVRAVLPAMLERGSGTIVIVTSVAHVTTWPGSGAYAATKAVLAVATETLRLELIGTGVHVLEADPRPRRHRGAGRDAAGARHRADARPRPARRRPRCAQAIVRAIDRRPGSLGRARRRRPRAAGAGQRQGVARAAAPRAAAPRPTRLRSVLIGRQSEIERIERLVAGARAGRGGAILVRGEAGIGKTSLLAHARELAARDLVLEARGIETEAEIPYAGLWDLLGPILDLRDRLPEAQAIALGQALALGPEGTPARFAVPAAVLGLLSAATEERAAVCLVDDVQWLDAPSTEAIVFAARRLGGESVAMLLAAREGAGRRVDTTGIDEIDLGPLAPASAAELLRREHGERLSWAVAGELLTSAAGNPMALVELPLSLTAEQLVGKHELPPVLPAGQSLEEAFRRRLAVLPDHTREALVVAAALAGSEDLSHLAQALAAVGLEPSALDEAEAAGVIALEQGRALFRHPLLRAAAYHAATPPERRAAHRALAETAAPGAPSRAWHLAAAVAAADENVARDLEEAANDARRRGGHASAARAFARAAQLTPDPGERARRLLDAALDHVAAGALEYAHADAESGLAYASDPLVKTALERIRAHVEIRTGRPGAGARAMVAAAQAIEGEMPPLAATMLLEAGLGVLLTGPAYEAIEIGERARELSGGVELLEGIADILIGQALVAAGDWGKAKELFDAREAFMLEADVPPGVAEVFASGAHGSMWLERFDRAQRVIDRVIDEARAAGALAQLAYPLAVRAQLGFRRGAWTAGYADAEEAARVSRETGQESALSYALQMQAEIEAALGRFEEARGHASDAIDLALRTETPVFGPYARASLGAIALAEGQLDVAVSEYETARQELLAIDMPAPGEVLWTVELVEAHARANAADKAAAELARLEELVGEAYPAVQQGQLHRCRALAAADHDEGVAHFERALEHHGRSRTPFEQARTQLAYGERLRRRKARVEARDHLRAALDTFERLGARPWADRARAELRTGGGAAASATTAPLSELLTPHELQVAMIVARGATNKEVAAQLFVSPKTVEHRLGNIYKKLEVRSRTELARIVTGQLAAEAA